MEFDAVIIGAGPSGLAAALRLSLFEKSVCLLEAHSRPGGYNSWHHVLGHEVSSGLHAFTNIPVDEKRGPLGKLFRQLRLKTGDLRLRLQKESSIRFPSATLRFDNDPERLRSEVAAVFPREIDGFDELRRRIRETDEGELTDRRSSARDVVSGYLRDPLLVDMLFCPVMFYGNPGGVGDGRPNDPARPDMDWLLFCVIWKCLLESGVGYPAGGIRPLWERIAALIGRNGGTIRLSTPVTELVVRGGRTTAARLASGEEIAGRYFFSSAGAVETEALLGDAAEKRRPVGEISIVEGVSVLDRPAPAAGMTDTIVFFSFADRLRFGRPEGLVEKSCGLACAPGNYLPEDPAENIVKVSQLASYPLWSGLSADAYGAAKNGAADVMAASLERIGVDLPAVRSAAGRYGVFDDVFTPTTLARFTGHAGGALYGSPVKTRDGTTASENLFLIGADQGFHGIVGAMLSGVAMANLHMLAKS